MSRFLVVLNPKAGKGAGAKYRERIVDAFKTEGILFDLAETSRTGEATEIARLSAAQVVVAAGGDGTAHEVANGLVGSSKVLAVLPIGSGNDFVKAINVPRDLQSAVKVLARERVAHVDLGKVEIPWNPAQHVPQASGARYFVNGLGIGFDAAVAMRTQQIHYVSGTLVYLLAVLQTLGRYVAPQFEITVDGRTSRSRILLVAIGNGTCAGGGFYLTPDAHVSDGELDLCIVEQRSVLSILTLMPRVMQGQHRNIKGVKFERGQCATITSNMPVAVHVDGEILGDAVTGIRVSVTPGALRVIVGPNFKETK